MSILSYRRDRLDRIQGSHFSPSQSTVVVYRAGAQVKGNQGPVTTLNVLPGHYFPLTGGVQFCVMRFSGGAWSMIASSMRAVTSATQTTIVFTGSITVLDGDFLVNLGNDLGGANPLFTASTAPIYSTGNPLGAAVSQSRLTPNTQGEYQYFVGERNLWELVVSGTTPQELRVAVPLNDFGLWSVSVTDFGAVGDGVTDDTAAFLAASAYLPAVGNFSGGKVRVPRGNYVVASQITWTAGVVVEGESAWSSTITCKAGFSGASLFVWQKPASYFSLPGVGIRNLGANLNNQTCHGFTFYKGYDAVTVDTMYINNVGTAASAFRFEGDPGNATTDVSQTITMINTYAIHGGANATGPLYYFKHCQEMTLINCKGLASYVAIGVGACDVFYFLNCRGVAAIAISAGNTVGRGIRVVSDANGHSQFMSFYGATIEGCSTNSLATGEAVTVEGTAAAGPGPSGGYSEGINFHGLRFQEAALTPPIATGGVFFKNSTRCYAEVFGYKCNVDAACGDIRLVVNDPTDVTVAATAVRTHVDASYHVAINRMHRTFGENLSLLSSSAGGPEIILGVKTRLDFWEFLWAANATPADFGLRLRYVDTAGAAHIAMATDAQGTLLSLYGPTDTEVLRCSLGRANVLTNLTRSTSAAVTASTTHTQVGATALTSDFNNVSVCANADDAVKLPSAAAGMMVTVINSGANNLRIWPASGDNLGTGVDTVRLALIPTGVVKFVALDATVWKEV